MAEFLESFQCLAADEQSIVVSYAPSHISSRISQVLIQKPVYFVLQLCEQYLTLAPFKKRRDRDDPFAIRFYRNHDRQSRRSQPSHLDLL